MKIELRNVKYAEFNSEETNCFSAAVYLLNAWAKTLPPYTFEGDPYPHTADTAIGELFDEWLITRDLKKRITKKMLFTIKGKKGVFAVGFKQPQALEAIVRDKGMLAAFAERHKAERILNTLPFEEALQIFREALA
jgi:hypothetical protein